MKRRRFSMLPALGIGLVLVSIALLIGSQLLLKMADRQNRAVIAKWEGILAERAVGVPGMYPNSGMPVMAIDGVDYVAVLEIPAFGITLPVADQWSRNRLYRSPCRFFGSAYDSTLIIGGFDDDRQFGFCDKIGHDATVTVTDTTGAQFSYQVSRIDRAKHAETAWLTDPTWDLTLFCHDILTMEYLAVRCVLSYK